MDWNNGTSLLWLLAIGALFYWMMRKGGCGMHGGHAHGGGHQHGGGPQHGGGSSAEDKADRTIARDPVCGMRVDPDRAAGARAVSGQTFHFCSADCLEKFDADPEHYTRPPSQDRDASTSNDGSHAGHHRHAS